MPKILYYSSLTHEQGGAIELMYKLARHFHGHPDFEVTAVLPDREGIAKRYEAAQVPVRVVPFMALGAYRSLTYRMRYLISLPATIYRIIRVIREEEVDLVHVNEVTFFSALIAAKIASVPAICHVRVILRNRFPLARVVLGFFVGRFSDHIISSSHATSHGLFDRPGEYHLTVSYDGGPDRTRLDPELYDRDKLRCEFCFEESFVVGMVSKLIPVKGHLYLIEAAALLIERHPEIGWKFVIVGGEVEGYEAYSSALRDRIEALGLEEHVLLLGRRRDVAELLYSFDVATHVPDHDDPFPGVVLEALAMERPIVATKSGGIPEQFESGVSGILIEKRDVEQLAQELIFLANSPEKRREMGQAGRRYVQEQFSPERHFAEVEEIYWKLLGERGV